MFRVIRRQKIIIGRTLRLRRLRVKSQVEFLFHLIEHEVEFVGHIFAAIIILSEHYINAYSLSFSSL